jgi:inward rectifier potassium channel
MLILTEFENGSYVRKYYTLPLERNSVLFMPLSWTIVHPFDEKSPLNGKSTEELIQMDAEMIVLITGFDDTFSQTVHSRYSYLMSDLIWGAKFEPSFETTDKGEVILHVDRINDWSPISSELK